MYGYVTLEYGPGRRSKVVWEELGGLPVLHQRVKLRPELSGARRERRVRQAAARLWNCGVSKVLTPPDFPHWDALRRGGLAPVDTGELCRAAAAELALAALEHRKAETGRAVVALAGKTVTPAMVRTAERLAGRVYGIMVCAGREGMALAHYLQEEYGLPMLLGGAVGPTLTVAFDGSGQWEEPCMKLWGERPELLGARIWTPGLELPGGCDSLPLLAALRESGRLADGSLRAKPLDILE